MRPLECRPPRLHRLTLLNGIVTTLFTVGHGTLPQDDFVSLIHAAGIDAIVDVRTAPGSRRHPHFRRQAMEEWLPLAGVHYRWEPALGGLRKPSPDSPNVALRNSSFRAYADHMGTPEFVAALHRVLTEAAARPTAVMCAETLWWRCHRRLLSDFAVLVGKVDVRHLVHDGRLVEHRATEGVRVDGDHLAYDLGETGSLLA